MFTIGMVVGWGFDKCGVITSVGFGHIKVVGEDMEYLLKIEEVSWHN